MFDDSLHLSSSFGPSDFSSSNKSKSGSLKDTGNDFTKRNSVSAKTTQQIELRQPTVPIQAIHQSPFGDYNSCIIMITKLMGIMPRGRGTSFFRVFFRIRLNPRSIVESNHVVCVDTDVDLNIGYCIDFTHVLPEDVQNHQPSIELYRKSNDNEDVLIGIAILPIRVKCIRQIDGKSCTIMYLDDTVNFIDYVSNRKICSALVSLALCYPEHIDYFRKLKDSGFKEIEPIKVQATRESIESTMQIRQPLSHVSANNIPVSVPKKSVRRIEESTDDENYEEEEKYDDERHRRRHRRHTKRNKPRVDWAQQAMIYGWRPPGSFGDWKEKARKKGWRPPDEKVYSSIAVHCSPKELSEEKRTKETQTENVILDEQGRRPAQPGSATGSESTSYDVVSLMKLLNNSPSSGKKSSAQGSAPSNKGEKNATGSTSSDLSIGEPYRFSAPERATRVMCIMKPISIFNCDPLPTIDIAGLDEDSGSSLLSDLSFANLIPGLRSLKEDGERVPPKDGTSNRGILMLGIDDDDESSDNNCHVKRGESKSAVKALDSDGDKPKQDVESKKGNLTNIDLTVSTSTVDESSSVINISREDLNVAAESAMESFNYSEDDSQEVAIVSKRAREYQNEF